MNAETHAQVVRPIEGTAKVFAGKDDRYEPVGAWNPAGLQAELLARLGVEAEDPERALQEALAVFIHAIGGAFRDHGKERLEVGKRGDGKSLTDDERILKRCSLPTTRAGVAIGKLTDCILATQYRKEPRYAHPSPPHLRTAVERLDGLATESGRAVTALEGAEQASGSSGLGCTS